MAAKTTAPPASWAAPSSSPSHNQATTVAAIGSNMAVMLARVAGMKLSEPTSRQKGTIVPSTIIHPISDQTGSPQAPEAASSIRPVGNVHHGWTTAQKSEAKRKPYVVSEIASRRPSSRSATRM